MPENYISKAHPWVTTKSHCFKYHIDNFGPLPERFNIGKWEIELEQGEFGVEEKTSRYTLYRSAIKHDPYLLVLEVDPFTFVFYMHTESDVAHWKQHYAYLTPSGLLNAFLPEKPADINITFIPFNKNFNFSKPFIPQGDLPRG